MKNKEPIINALKNITLPTDARVRMRAELSAYADSHAVSAPSTSPFFGGARVFLGRFSYALIASALLIFGGGVAYAAHSALPGDPLYPVKVALLEPAEKTFRAQTPAAWSITLVNRRLDEADRVASRASPSPKRDARAALEVANAAQKVQVHLERLPSPSPSKTEAVAAFNETLSAHERTLERLTAAATSTNAATRTASVLGKLFTETRARGEEKSSKHSTSTRDRARTPERKPANMKKGGDPVLPLPYER